ncbi:MAG: lipopolysaccharide biosynthesis protein [Burkholderiaceae bacterium]
MSSADQDCADLTGRSIGGVLWGIAGTLIRATLQIVAQVVLARMLGPEQYGLFAVAVVVILFSGFFADVGLAYSLIQRPQVSERDIRFVFSWQFLLGALVTALLWFGAPVIGDWYGDARYGDVLGWLSLTCLIHSLGTTAQMLLRREMRFKEVNLAAVIGYAIGFVGIGIPMAWLGAGVYALVAAFLVQATIETLLCLWWHPHPLRPLLRHGPGLGIVRFGLTAFLTSLLNWLMTSLDRLVVPRVLDATGAGLYATLGNFVSGPSVQVLALLQNVFYSASAGVQDDTARLRHGLRSMFGVVALLLTPVFVGAAVAAETLVLAVYGDAWVAGAVVLRGLSLAMPALLIMGMAVPVLWSSGRIEQELRLQLPLVLIWLAVLWWVAAQASLAWFAAATCALYYLRAAVIVRATLLAVQMSAGALMRLWIAPALCTLAVAASAAVAEQLVPLAMPAPLRLALIIIACALALLLALRPSRALAGRRGARSAGAVCAARWGAAGVRLVRGCLQA